MDWARNPVARVIRDAVARAGRLLRRLALRSFAGRRRLPNHARTALPSILVVTIPKSGTVFINQMLSRGLSLEPGSVSFGYFPHYLVDIPKLLSFIEGGQAASAHFDASPVNLQSLTPFVKKWVVHVRDPRSVLLSWVHHTNRLYGERHNGKFEHLFVYPAPPEPYYSWPFQQQIDWNIDHFLPRAVAWTRSWLAVCDTCQYNILLTSYSDLARDETAYINQILDFYGIPRSLFRRPQIEKTVLSCHYRVGSQNEWLTAFNAGQIARTTAMIGDDLIERFGWDRGVAAARMAS
jgi:hypothetical protein